MSAIQETKFNQDQLLRLKNFVETLKDSKIMVIGDLGLDEYVFGQVKRISPEAPVPVCEVNDTKSIEFRLGLSANVAQNIKSLGGEPLLISVVNDDESGKKLKDLLQKVEVSTEFLIRDENRPTTRKLRIMTGHHHIVRVDFENKSEMKADIFKKIFNMIENNISFVNGVIIQDYAKGMIKKELVQFVCELAHKKNIKVLVDPHKDVSLETYYGADLMTPNYDEALALSRLPIKNTDLEVVGNKLKEMIGSSQMVVTQGKEGMTVFDQTEMSHIPTLARKVFDVTGAGDTVISTITLAWCNGLSLQDACLLSNFAAGIVVAKVGCVPCSKKELLKSIQSRFDN